MAAVVRGASAIVRDGGVARLGGRQAADKMPAALDRLGHLAEEFPTRLYHRRTIHRAVF